MIIFPKRLLFVSALIITVCMFFWLGSRYPALNQKAMMAQSGSVADTIAAFPILEVKADFPLWKKILYTTINWANDNKKGMTFGVIIGGLFLTLVNYLQFRQKGHKMLKTLYGFMLGSPLGVCVNCAAPVFKGVLQSRQAEMAFAMMLSSPTMNIVVLTMVFSLFPFYMAITKVLFVLTVIFLGVPLLSTILGPDHQLKDLIKVDAESVNLGQNCASRQNETWVTALIGFFRDIFKNIWFIIARTVPLMLVAGFLGAVVSHAISLDSLMQAEGFGVIVLVAFVGLFLPVPVAFDVMLVNALFSAGMAPHLALILLCSLGIYSAYSFMITWQSASRQWALGISAIVLILSVGVGLSGETLHQSFYMKPNIASYKQMRGSIQAAVPEAAQAESSPADQQTSPNAEALVFEPFLTKDDLVLSRVAFIKKDNNLGHFVRAEGSEIGLTEGFAYGIRDYPDPFWLGRGTASADYDQDGWIDVALGSDKGVMLYQNSGGQFEKVALNADTGQFRVYAVAFVDWNSDGWLDIFFTTFNRGNYVIFNEQGNYLDELHKVPNFGGILTVSPSFGDIDQDGFIDVFNGNMALGIISGFFQYGKGRENSVTWNRNLNYDEQRIEVVDGETMAALVSDFNHDGHLDIYANNDFVVPDYLFFGSGGRALTLADPEFRKTMSSPIFSMSIDTGDLNNDGKLDYVSSGTLDVDEYLNQKPVLDGKAYEDYSVLKDGAEICQGIEQEDYRQRCLDDRNLNRIIDLRQKPKLNIQECARFNDPIKRDDCLLAVMWMIVTNNRPFENCKEQFGFDPVIEEICVLHSRRGGPMDREQFNDQMKQVDQPAIYLANDSGNGFHKVTVPHPGGWTWSMKIADLDNDGWQDIFNAEGAVRQGQYGFNVVLRNLGGKSFEQKQFSWKLTDDFGMYSFTYIDYDQDGDLDVVANSAVGPVRVFENKLNQNERIAFEIKLPEGNRFGLHTKIYVTAEDGSTQMREIKPGAGYQSFDAPIAYFGLGNKKSIRRLRLEIPGRETLVLDETLASGFRYRLELK